MHTRRKLFNSTRTNPKSKLELRGKEELRAQRKEQRILKRVGDRLEFVTDRRVRGLQQREPSPGMVRAHFAMSALTLLLSALFLVLPALAARAEVSIQEVKSKSGITAWLVEDYSVPLISFQFAFKGGRQVA